MRVVVLPPTPAELARALDGLRAAGKIEWREATAGDPPAGGVDVLLAAAQAAAAVGEGAASGEAPLTAVWGPASAACSALNAGADLWIDLGEAPELLAARLAAALRSRARGAPARHDSLTDLPGPRAFDDLLAHEFDRAARYRRTLALIVLEPDGLDQLGAKHGAHAAHAALRRLAEVLRPLVRDVDTLARLRGSRIALLFPETDGGGALSAAARLHKTLVEQRWTPRLDGRAPRTLPLRASVGLAAYPARGIERPQDLHGRALESLVQAQRAGGDRVVAFGAPDIIWSRQAPDPSLL